ncbi:hypothetical protein [Cryobacterium sp. MDB2-33-2]|uniref:hypothetical protein n=1 Tax=Cryobacterium sp. MDB2-33-2 TaxID=1259179 RepID=UPI001069A762|nr:hypothetical protein [Cryobacterium sp. MDB2-33-2]TFC11089.1 hypothetical protein E3O59_02145 [Cryobacterium sp. MDB2-33-2]
MTDIDRTWTKEARVQGESLWREIESKWGLLTLREVLNVLDLPEGNEAEVTRLQAEGRLLAFKRGGEWAYPGFQVDAESGLIEPVIADLVKLASDLNWPHDELVLWLCSPSGYFGGDRPVDHLHEPEALLEKARNEWTVEW